MVRAACRACRGTTGDLVLDLGEQPACDYFPPVDDPGPDPVYPLQMWLSASCGLAQLVADPTVPEEPKAKEPAALIEQASDAVERVARAGFLPERGRVAEYGSPHGGSWLGMLAERGLLVVDDGEEADVIVDCFGLMHSTDQSAALGERAARIAADGVLLLQYHSLDTIVNCGQWNVLRHGHYAYYSTTAMVQMLSAQGLVASRAWHFDLYGGTVLLAARHDNSHLDRDGSVEALLAGDAALGVRDPAVVGQLRHDAKGRAAALHSWLLSERAAGRRVVGYGAASRAVALLVQAKVDHTLLPAVFDASPAKQGLRMPGTDIPVLDPAGLVQQNPDSVLVFVPDLLAEVRSAFPSYRSLWGDMARR